MTDWPTVIASFIGSGFSASVLTAAINIFRESRKQSGDLKTNALFIALIYERYGHSCRETLSEVRQEEAQSLEPLDFNLGTLPDFTDIRKLADLSRFSVAHASKILEFEITVDDSNQFLSGVNADRSDWRNALTSVGLEAFRIAHILRRDFNLGNSRSDSINYSYQVLVDYQKQQEDIARRNQEIRAAWMKEFDSPGPNP